MIWVRKDLFEQASSAWSIISEKLAKSGVQKPCRILRRMKAAKRCLSLAEVNAHQALAAYNSLARKTLKVVVVVVAAAAARDDNEFISV